MTMNNNELMHYGVKGMKWGVRRYRNANGSLTSAGVKRYAKKGYAQDAYNSNKSALGKAYDRYTGAHKYAGDAQYRMSSDKQNKARAEKYLTDRDKARKETGKKIGKAINKTKEVAGKAVDKLNEKSDTQIERNKQDIDKYGKGRGLRTLGVATAINTGDTFTQYQRTALRAATAAIVNSAANHYISNSTGSYYAKKGVDYTRRAAIMALSVNELYDEYTTARTTRATQDYAGDIISDRIIERSQKRKKKK